jgi:GTP-binding protein
MYGLIGFPNVGKSTILSVVTEAKPKIADYHFTTLEPNLGVVKTSYGDSFVLADIPGIIEGASEGVGLGLRFLRHIERTRLLLHVVDVSGGENRNPVEDFNIINEELKKYSEKLSTRKQILVANKIDSMQDEELYNDLEKLAKEKNMEIFKISAVTNEGLKELFIRVSEVLKTLPSEDILEGEERVVYTLKEDRDEFEIYQEKGLYIVVGPAIEKLIGRVNMEDNESMHFFQKMLRTLGVDDKLREMGVREGDTVKFIDYELEWYD